ncbi:MAG: FprA family A-type flavoprotein [Lachnospiraceae bacterium]|nr:FprA family A-type flavoprotein [Lachnospiraceae bacterium]MBP3458561.1 FprA family A-type flavoprotein [Lachnospiraceae bacterium]
MKSNVTNDVFYVGADDRDLDLFEGQYIIPNGVSYNSYVIMDEKIAIMDMVDRRAAKDWFANLEEVLGDKKPDYLIISHLEPDHSANLAEVLERYPEIQIVSNAKLFGMLPNFFDVNIEEKKVTVAEGDTLSLGKHTLHFVMAPMVHWPEVMVTYEETDKILFSADGFGKFGALDTEEDWACEARRYYFNIVGKYGAPVQALLKKAAALDIQIICPLHGPVLSENLEYYIGKYQTWSSYEPEDKGVFIAYSSLHGNTKQAAEKLAEILEADGVEKVAIADLAREDMAECIEDAFRYDRLVVAAPTYDAGVMPVMVDFIHHLKAKAYQKRRVGIIENGSWAPIAGKLMKEQFESMKDVTVLENIVTIRSTVKEADIDNLKALAKELEKTV